MTAARTLFSLAFLLMALGTPSFAQNGSSQADASCDAQTDADWPEGITARGTVTGPCRTADIMLTLTSPTGAIVWKETYSSTYLFEFNSATNAVEMQATLDRWLDDYARTRTTGTLPDWPLDADSPYGSEYPFFVDVGVTRKTYIARRQADRPMVCYPAGMESARCLIIAPEGASVDTVGVQSFPG